MCPIHNCAARSAEWWLHAQDCLYVAYFAPYPLQRHFELVARMQSLPRVRQEVLGQSVDGYDLDLLVIGTPCIILCGDGLPTTVAV